MPDQRTSENATRPPLRCVICRLGGVAESARDLANALRGAEPEALVAAINLDAVETDSLPDLVRRERAGVVFLAFPAIALPLAVEAVPRLQSAQPGVAIIAVTDLAIPEPLNRLLELGVADYLTPPLRASDVICRARRWGGTRHAECAAAHGLREWFGLQGFVGRSPALLTELNKLPSYARVDSSVLILGETGTGKELCARALHHLSLRASGPFMAVNVGAMPAELIENELFGHESGAYTSARGPAPGLIAAAEAGTLFLDEIDALPLTAQVKLLRFLQEKEYRPLGGRQNLHANVRVVAASNADLPGAVAAGRFRKDLFYRLNVLPLTLPALNARKEDLPLLARHFVARQGDQTGRRKLGLSPDALAKLQSYDWPGNVRELESVIERAVVLSEDWVIGARDIDLPVPDPPVESAKPETFRTAKARVVRDFESEFLREKLESHGGNITQAARAAGKNRRAFFELMRKHRIVVRPALEPEELKRGR